MTEIVTQRIYNPEGSTLRRAQLRMAEMLSYIDTICYNNNIIYWMDFGTLLGAARHKGFIPWDDDTDICMPIDDYNRFKNLLISSDMFKSNQFVIECHETDKKFFKPWISLRDTKSTYLHNDVEADRADKKLKFRGLQVDIFPVEKDILPKFHHICHLYQKYLIDFPQRNIHHMAFLEWSVPLSYWLLHKFIKPLLRFLGRFNSNDYLVTSYGIQFTPKRYLRDVYPLQRIPFEGLMLCAPHNLDNYLTEFYGNWRKIPSANEIRTHNVNILIEE